MAGTKIYEVTSINWWYSCIEAKETDLSVGDVPESELWDIAEFGDYEIKLVNGGDVAKVIDFREWVEMHKRV